MGGRDVNRLIFLIHPSCPSTAVGHLQWVGASVGRSYRHLAGAGYAVSDVLAMHLLDRRHRQSSTAPLPSPAAPDDC